MQKIKVHSGEGRDEKNTKRTNTKITHKVDKHRTTLVQDEDDGEKRLCLAWCLAKQSSSLPV